MKKFLIQLLAFASIVLVSNLILNIIFPLKLKDSYALRENYLFDDNRISNYNLLCFGTSRTRNHIDPVFLDSLNQLTGLSTKSFNLGLPGSNVLEISYLYEKFLDKYEKLNQKTVKYVLLESHQFRPIADKNLKTEKSFYWVDGKNLAFTTKYLLKSKKSKRYKIKTMFGYVVSFCLRTFGFNYIRLAKDEELTLPAALGRGGQGFFPRDDVEANDVMARKLRADLIKDTALLHKNFMVAKKFFEKGNFFKYGNRVDAERLKNLAKRSKSLGIQLIHVVHPRLVDYDVVLGTLDLAAVDKITIADPRRYPNLWYLSNSSDIGHLNLKGTRAFNTYLSADLVKLIKHSKLE